MKFIYALIASFILIVPACKSKKITTEHANHNEQAPQPAADTLKKSIPKEEHALIGSSHITIKYYAPAVRGRQIWGGLVPFDEVWVTGAHRATSFEINRDFTIEGKLIASGKYALFTIPGKEKWVFIINKKWDQHLADEYDQKEDIARIEIKPEAKEENQERLLYKIEQSGEKNANIIFRWEKIRIVIPIKLNNQ